MNTTATTVSDSHEDATRPTIFNVPVARGTRGRIFMLIPLIMMLFVGILVSAAVFTRQSRRVFVPLTAAVSFILPLGGVLLFQRRRARRIERMIDDDVDLATLFRNIAEKSDITRGHASMKRAVQRLAAKGSVNQVVRVAMANHLGPIRAIRVPFEARLLNEADEAFDELAEAVDPYDSELTEHPHPASGGADADPPRKRTSHAMRNVMVKGGKWIAIAFLFNLVLHAFLAYEKGRITFSLVAWCAATFMMFSAAPGKWWSPTNWLIAPAALIRRRKARRGNRSDLHVFARGSSLLCIYQVTKLTWSLAVSDGRETETIVVTPHEARMAQRAWLSPLDAPSADSLSDLT